MNGLLHPRNLARWPRLPGLARALRHLRRPAPSLPLYRSEGFGEDLEAFDARYRPAATIMRWHAGRAEDRKQ